MENNLKHKKKTIAKIRVYNTILGKAKGLMFAPPLQKKQGIILASSKEDLFGIHMLFVFFPIDVVWLNKQKKVIHIVRNIKPFTLSVQPPKKAQFIVELPKNASVNIKQGDKLEF